MITATGNRGINFVKMLVLSLLVASLVLVGIAPATRANAAEPAMQSSYRLDGSALKLNSKNALLLSLDTGEILLDIGSQEPVYPASMTKIMTAIVAIEQLGDLSQEVLLREGMYDSIYAANASTAGFLPGEKVQALDLLYGVLLSSGAECSIGLAEHIAGSEAAFVALMNEKARQLGMAQTNFTNVCGLYGEEHYASLRDMAVLLRYALKNEIFYQVFTTQEHVTKKTNLHPNALLLPSTLFSKLDAPEFSGGRLLGGKTGFIYASGQCLASLAEKDGSAYILITAGAYPEDYRTQTLHIDDAFTVYNAL